MDAQQKNIRVQQWVAFLSIILLGAKLIAYYLTHSVAILTDALEGIVNVVAGFFGLYSLRIAARPRDSDHPYGHGKVEFISAGVEGSMIVIAGCLIAYKSITSFLNPHLIEELDFGIILIAGTAIVNYIAGSISVRIGKRNNSLQLLASGKHLQSDTYTTLGVLVGLFLIYITNISWIDSLTGLIFSGWILYTGYKILRSSVAGIMDESDADLLNKMVATLNNNREENWIDLHNIRIIKYGPVLHLDGHLTIPWYLNVREAHVEIDKLAALIRDEFDESIELFVHTDGCLDFSCKICSKSDCPVRKHSFEKRIEWTVANLVRDNKHKISTKE